MTLPATSETVLLLRELIEALVEHKGEIDLELLIRPSAAYLVARVAPEDAGKVRGKFKAHELAIAHLAAQLAEDGWPRISFSIAESTPRDDFRPSAHPRSPGNYDERPLISLLERLLEGIGVSEYQVAAVDRGVDPNGRLKFELVISVRSEADQALLLAPPAPPATLSNVAALGTLFRAIATRAGVRVVNVSVIRR